VRAPQQPSPSQGAGGGTPPEVDADPKSHSPHAHPLPEDTEEAELLPSDAGGHRHPPPAMLGPLPAPPVSTQCNAGGSRGSGSWAQRPAPAPREAALLGPFPWVYSCKQHAGALLVPRNYFRGTNSFAGFPEQSDEEQRCTAPNHLPTTLGICLRHSSERV